MKDFFDLYVLSQEFAFEGERLRAAIGDVFTKRATPIPLSLPDGLSLDFAHDPDKQSQWRAFLRQSVAPPQDTISLEKVIPAIAAFLWPVLEALAKGAEFSMNWAPGGLWTGRED
jgi:Nucleotidyl transferase AbiEii toxin, Type IV TA system